MAESNADTKVGEDLVVGDSINVSNVGDVVRQRNLTEKGLNYQIEMKQRKFRNLISTWRRKASNLECLLSERAEVDKIKSERDSAIQVMFEISNVYYELDELLIQIGQMGSKYEIFEDIEREHYLLIKRVSEFARCADETGSKSNFEGSERKSKSRSSLSSSSSIKADAAAKVASLQAKLKYIEVKAKYKTALEKIKCEIAGAESKAIDKMSRGGSVKFDEDLPDESVKYTEEFVQAHSNPPVEPSNISGAGYSTHTTWTNLGARPTPLVPDVSASIPFVPSTDFNSTAQPAVTLPSGGEGGVPDSTAQVDKFVKVIAEQVTLSRLPVPEPGIFSGDPLQYPGWKCALDTLLENKGIPSSEKIYYLKKYLSGPPREALEGYFLIPSDNTYVEARKLLEDR